MKHQPNNLTKQPFGAGDITELGSFAYLVFVLSTSLGES
jgi:hypothetical protein